MKKNKFKKKNLNVLSVNTFTFVLSIFFLTIGYQIQSRNFLVGTLINEIFIILIPALFLCRGGRIRDVLRVRPLGVKNFFRTIIIVIFSYPIILLLNGIFLTILSNFIGLENYPIDYNESVLSYLFYICLIPAICEEIFFRGALINSYNIYGRKFAIIMSALVFALFHFDVQNFVAPLLLGILFGNLLELSDSIFSPMIGHFLNNLIAFFSAKYVNDFLFDILDKTSLARDIGSLQLYIIIVLSVVSFIAVFVIKFIFKRMKEDSLIQLKQGESRLRTRVIESVDFFNFAPIVTLIILYFIYFIIVF